MQPFYACSLVGTAWSKVTFPQSS